MFGVEARIVGGGMNALTSIERRLSRNNQLSLLKVLRVNQENVYRHKRVSFKEDKDKQPRVLFACVHNAGRSQIAAANTIPFDVTNIFTYSKFLKTNQRDEALEQEWNFEGTFFKPLKTFNNDDHMMKIGLQPLPVCGEFGKGEELEEYLMKAFSTFGEPVWRVTRDGLTPTPPDEESTKMDL
jgi:hypothetical protein